MVFPLVEELELCDRETPLVLLADKNVADKVDEVIDKTYELPMVIIGREHSIKIVNGKGNLPFSAISIKPFDGSPTLAMDGTSTLFGGNIQIVVMARSIAVAKEIGKTILLFNSQWGKHYYDSVFIDKDSKKYLVSDITYLKLLDTKNKEFSSSTNEELPISVIATEYEFEALELRMKNQDFKQYSEFKVCKE